MTRIVEQRAGVLVSSEAAESSTGFGDAGRIPQLDAAGVLDPSFFPGSGLSVNWGDIAGSLSAQADLVAALAAKLDDSQASAYGLSILAAANAAAAKTLLALVKGDVGLGNVDDTSDVAKNAAAAILTNKDLTSGTNLFPILNQNTTGSAATLATPRNFSISGGGITAVSVSFNGSVPVVLNASINADAISNSHINAAAGIAVTKLAAVAASRALVSDASGFISVLATTAAEILYLNGVTSAVQTQIDGKQPLDSDLTTIAGLTATTDNFIVSVGSAWASRTPAQVRTTLALGTAAVKNTGTSGDTVAVLNGAATTWGAGSTWGGDLVTSTIVNIANSGVDGVYNEIFRSQIADNLGTGNWRNSIYGSASSTPSNSRFKFSLANSQTTQVDVLTLSGDGVADVTGLLRCDSFRIDAAPTVAASIPSTHKLAFSANGTTYYFLLSNV